jgi:serine/threonine protein phosphatase PrpC
MDSSTYGSMVNHGGHATGGIASPTLTMTAFRCGADDAQLAETIGRLFAEGKIQLTTARDPDDGCAGVPAKV